MKLLSEDDELQNAIPAELSTSTKHKTNYDSDRPAKKLADLTERRRKLLEFCYADRIPAELFGEQESEISRQIEAVREEATGRTKEDAQLDELAGRFEQVAATLRQIDVDRVWSEATEAERKVLVKELVEKVVIFPDHLEVTIHGAPRLNVTYPEMGLSGPESQIRGVEGGSHP
jgi:hypothetical protein